MEDDCRNYRENTSTIGTMRENLEQSSIQIMIESRLPAWVLDKVYQQKKQEP
ncbi:unnamed protein product, partial [Onchocerca ochengi]|uniref:Histidine kinase n=1 Tax=Onchocerca ochengi TaxID=42157 RepID=A0A182DXA9_ONCOC